MTSSGLSYHDVSYWEQRFGSDARESAAAGGFEWLSTGSELLERTMSLVLNADRHLNILHIGVGTSALSLQIMHFYRQRFPSDWAERCARIVNVDFSTRSTAFQQLAERKAFSLDDDEPLLMQYRTLDLLNTMLVRAELATFLKTTGKFDVILDKSTTDAISTSPDVNLSVSVPGFKGLVYGPTTQKLALTLATIAKSGCKWLCHSYSSNRWQDLTLSPHCNLFPWVESTKTPVQLPSDQINAPTLYHYIYEMHLKP